MSPEPSVQDCPHCGQGYPQISDMPGHIAWNCPCPHSQSWWVTETTTGYSDDPNCPPPPMRSLAHSATTSCPGEHSTDLIAPTFTFSSAQ